MRGFLYLYYLILGLVVILECNQLMPTKRVLFISNGHGEDLNACEVLKALRHKYLHVETIALPLVGDGNAYRRAGVEIATPTKALPSGGFGYMSLRKQIADFQSGLLSLTWQQIRAAKALVKPVILSLRLAMCCPQFLLP